MNLAESLTGLLKTHGSGLLRDRQRLFDLASGWEERERVLLMTAWRSGVGERLLRDGGELSQRQGMKVLTDEFWLSPEAAWEIVCALNQALKRASTSVFIPASAKPRFWRDIRTLWRPLAFAWLLTLLGVAIAWSLWLVMDVASFQAAQERRNRLQHEFEEVRAEAQRKPAEAAVYARP